jgi:hypothetical protein
MSSSGLTPMSAPAAKLSLIHHLPKMMANPANAYQPVTSIKFDEVKCASSLRAFEITPLSWFEQAEISNVNGWTPPSAVSPNVNPMKIGQPEDWPKYYA